MTNTLVVEQKIYKSNNNIRFDLVSLRKAFPALNVTQTSRTFSYGDTLSLASSSFIHVSSNADLTITLNKGSNSITLVTSLFTTYFDSFDSILIENLSSEDIEAYIVNS